MPEIGLSVVIVNYNSGGLLRECLDSLLRQTVSPETIVVVDNLSTDHSADFLIGLAGVTLVQAGANLGFAAASNLGVTYVQACEWVVMLNPDTVVPENWIASMVTAIALNPEYDSFSCRMMKIDNQLVIDGLGDSYHISGRPRRRYHGELYTASEKFHLPMEVFSACGGAAIYRKETFLELGGFDESFFCYIEDVDLGFRLRLMGHKCLYIPDAVVYHVGSACSGFRSDFQIYYAHRNLVWAFFKNMPLSVLVLALPLHIALNIMSLLLFCLRGKGGVIFRAKRDALVGLPRIWRARKHNLEQRIIPINQLLKSFSLKLE